MLPYRYSWIDHKLLEILFFFFLVFSYLTALGLSCAVWYLVP